MEGGEQELLLCALVKGMRNYNTCSTFSGSTKKKKKKLMLKKNLF
jgi:hypothetical protein